MTILSAKLVFHIPYAQSLKDKRQVKRSLLDRVHHKFNISAAEVDTQDSHQTLTIGLAVVSGSHTHAREVLDEAVRFLETHTDAELVSLEMDH